MVAIAVLKSNHQESVVQPGFAVVFYEDSQSKMIVCATRHQVNSETNTLGLGTIISPSQITKTFSELNIDKSKKHALSCIPEKVIFDSDDLIVWYTKRFIGDMWFRHGSKPQRLVVEWPPLVFAAHKLNPALHVFALSKNTRPNEQTILFHAPLMNINDEGRLCQGTAHLPQDISINSIDECEATLFDSQFTHVNHEFTFKHETNNQTHFKYWKSKSRTRKQFPIRLTTNEMARAGLTLQEFIKEQSNA